MKKRNKNFGFTLVELLVVIAIIGVLTTLIMVNFVGSRERANDSQKMQNLTSLKNALRLYYNDNQKYPDNIGVIKGVGFSAYISDLGDTSFEYNQTNGGDGFTLKIELESGVGADTNNSQLNCNLTPTPGFYAVCSN